MLEFIIFVLFIVVIQLTITPFMRHLFNFITTQIPRKSERIIRSLVLDELNKKNKTEYVVVFKLIAETGTVPKRATLNSAGYDLCSLDDFTVMPHSSLLVPVGVCIEQMPINCYGQIHSKSSIALMGVDVSAGVIDADYKDEIHVLLRNTTDEPKTFSQGRKIAQLIFHNIAPQTTHVHAYKDINGVITMIDTTNPTTVRNGGFGSTGQ